MIESDISALSNTLVSYCLDVKKGEKVIIQATPEAEKLVEYVHEKVLKSGGHPWQRIQFEKTEKIFYDNADNSQIDFISPMDYSVINSGDKFLFIRTETNTEYLKNVPIQSILRRRNAIQPLQSIMLKKRWCTCLLPSLALAQRAGMAIEEYSDIFSKIINQDWSKLTHTGQKLADLLDNSSSIIIEGLDTKLQFSIDGRKAVVGDGKFNFPDGEVFTSPVEDSANGEIYFDIPVDFEGQKISGIKLKFLNGVVVKASAEKGEEVLSSLLNIDSGSNKIGEFGIGINYNICQPMGHIALDEKIGGTCHLAIGFSLPGTGGCNKSAIHFDLIKDLRQNARIIADGKSIMIDGKLQLP